MEVGHYHNAPIHLHAGFLITAFILAWPFWPMVGLRGNVLALLFMAIIFASILAHAAWRDVMACRAAARYSRAGQRRAILASAA